MDKRKRRNLITLGLLTIVATVVFFWGLFWLLGTPVFKGGMDVVVLLSDGGSLKRSDRVQLRGVQVGLVRQVQLSSQGRGVIVNVRLNDNLALPTDSRAVVRGDVFGAHMVELIPGESMIKLQKGDTIVGAATPQLTQIATDLSTRVESVLASANALLSPQAVSDVHATASVLPASAQELRAAFAELRLAAVALRRTAENVQGAEAGTALGSAIGEVERSAQALTRAAGSMEQSLGSFASVMDKINNGNGTLGKLVNESATLDELTETLREVRALATDIRARPSRYITVRVF